MDSGKKQRIFPSPALWEGGFREKTFLLPNPLQIGIRPAVYYHPGEGSGADRSLTEPEKYGTMLVKALKHGEILRFSYENGQLP